MTLQDLPEDVQQKLLSERVKLWQTMHANDAWHVAFVNKEGTRYFEAYRRNDFTRWSGGSMHGWWRVRYGKVLWDRSKQPIGNDYDYFWVFSNHTFKRSMNGTDIPKEVHTKKEVIELAKAIGIFDI